MQHYWSLEPVQLKQAWLTIGAYDGVHRGHQTIIRQMTAGAHAEGAPAVVLTFHPHPSRIVRGRTGPLYLTSPEQRAELLGDLGVDVVITHPFNTETANLPGRAFLELLEQHLHMRTLWVGYDFAMGHGRDTDVAALRSLSSQFGYQLYVVPEVLDGGEPISSSRIRELLLAGEVAAAARDLGRPYRISGKVIPGDGRGRTIGVPTANLEIWEEQVIPERGVYACRAEVDGQRWMAAVNIGIRPTFDGKSAITHVEAHLLDAQLDLYGKTLNLEFIERLRGEQKFPDVQSLVDQIQQDIAKTRRLLQK
jgi:riboflavin kinase/FMN adenylyltransferase